MRGWTTVFRDYEEFKERILNCSIKAVEAESAKGQPAPNMVFFRSADRSLYADGVPVIVKTLIVVELYTERNDTASECYMERWFFDNKIDAVKTERVWLTSENWYQTIYQFELIFDE